MRGTRASVKVSVRGIGLTGPLRHVLNPNTRTLTLGTWGGGIGYVKWRHVLNPNTRTFPLAAGTILILA